MGRLLPKFFPAALSSASFSQEVPSGNVDGSNTSFSVANTPSAATGFRLTVDGVFQRQGVDYTLSGSTITMTNAPAVGSTLDAIYFK